MSLPHIRHDSSSTIPRSGRRTAWLWSSLIAIGGFLFGYETGVIAGALLFITPEFDLSAFAQGSVVSALLLGAMLGALVAGRVADRLGRRMTFGIEGGVFIVGALTTVCANAYIPLLAGRFTLGIAIGALSATVPVYLSEVSPAQIRGRTMTLNQLLMTIGILSAYTVNFAFSGMENWRIMLAIGIAPAVVMIVAACMLLPESPEWLWSRGKTEDAHRVLRSILGGAGATAHLQGRDRDGLSTRDGFGWRSLLMPRVRPALVVGATLAAVQQLSGINTIIYFAPSIIADTGLDVSQSIFYSIAIGTINLIMTIVSIRLVDRVGRRWLLLSSLGAMTATLTFLGLSFVLEAHPTVSLALMVAYIAAFAVGMGPVFWVLVGEIFPNSARAHGSSASTAINWGTNFAVSLMFLSVVRAIGLGETFWVFALVCAGSFVFVTKYVPETKGRDFEAVDTELQRRFARSGPARALAGAGAGSASADAPEMPRIHAPSDSGPR